MSRAFDACRQSILDRPVNWGDKSNAVDGRAFETHGSPRHPYRFLDSRTSTEVIRVDLELTVMMMKDRKRNSVKMVDAV